MRTVDVTDSSAGNGHSLPPAAFSAGRLDSTQPLSAVTTATAATRTRRAGRCALVMSTPCCGARSSWTGWRSCFAAPGDENLFKALDGQIEQDCRDTDHDDARDGQRCLEFRTGQIGKAADPRNTVVELRGDNGGPGEADRDPNAADHLGQRRGQHDVGDGLEPARPQRKRPIDALLPDTADTVDGGDRDRRERGEEQEPHLRGVADAEPDDQDADVA